MVRQTFNPSTERPWELGLCEFEVSLVCIASSSQDYIVKPCLRTTTATEKWNHFISEVFLKIKYKSTFQGWGRWCLVRDILRLHVRIYLKTKYQARKVVQWFGAQAALLEDSGSVLALNLVANICLSLRVQGHLVYPSALQRQCMDVVHRRGFRQNTYTF